MKRSPQIRVIDPVGRKLLAQELIPDRLLRRWNGLEIYRLSGAEAPHVMDEIGRIREVEFRRMGGGTGKAKDIDGFDLGLFPYMQLVSWDPESSEIVATYRYQTGAALAQSGPSVFATYELFDFSDEFVRDYLKDTIELGRSVVNRDAARSRLGLWSVWSGLGGIVVENPAMRFFFGKLTITRSYPPQARELMFEFLHEVFPGRSNLLWPREDVAVPRAPGGGGFARADGFARNYEKLQAGLKRWNVTVPPLLSSYVGLTEEVETFGTAMNEEFGQSFETAVLLPIREINARRREQFIESFAPKTPGLLG